MRRVSASSLLAAICFWLIAPLVLTGAELNLPACCRRNGAHHCAMPSEDAPAGGAAWHSVGQKCPVFPAASEAPIQAGVAVLESSGAIIAVLIHQPSVPRQAEALYRVSFSRSWHKRGPPVVLS